MLLINPVSRSPNLMFYYVSNILKFIICIRQSNHLIINGMSYVEINYLFEFITTSYSELQYLICLCAIVLCLQNFIIMSYTFK